MENKPSIGTLMNKIELNIEYEIWDDRPGFSVAYYDIYFYTKESLESLINYLNFRISGMSTYFASKRFDIFMKDNTLHLNFINRKEDRKDNKYFKFEINNIKHDNESFKYKFYVWCGNYPPKGTINKSIRNIDIIVTDKHFGLVRHSIQWKCGNINFKDITH